MNVHSPFAVPGNASDNGMDRFFGPLNLRRYRRLANAEIESAERTSILKMLAEEWHAFTRECPGRSLGPH